MSVTKRDQPVVRVRCFCGNLLAIAARSRKGVVCDRCHQPLPMRAIQLAIKDRQQAQPPVRAPAGV